MTLASAALTIAALLIPGVAFIWGYERWNEVYARRARDWPFRLAAISVVYLAVASGTIYWLASNYWADLAKLEPVPKWLAFVPFAYVVGAVAMGFALGGLVRWVGGYYGIGSYASAQGPKRDLLISRAVPFGENGAPIAPHSGTEDSGGPELRTSLLVKWDDIETLEFTTTDSG
ncbi:hypothetical protein [Candidatus Poriferisodalis sp.]|uniref:hypothetical protein n=1 Tax=Candidatus Poriferisodalis sp. TaxID=3101277 RepID=UPI003B524679